jgi:hypothetical protein
MKLFKLNFMNQKLVILTLTRLTQTASKTVIE